MARPRTAAAPRKRSGGGFLFGLFTGVALGLLVALGIAFYLNRAPIPFTTAKTAKSGEKEPAAKPPAIAGLPNGATTAPAPTTDKPKFDFYRILPGSEVPVTDRELREKMRQARATPPGQQEAPKDVYFIQAGSFQNPADADNQKARLAILGFESSVEPATLPDKGTWYRVRMGPYRKVEEINKVRQLLAQNNIDASLFKVKEQ